MPQVRSLEVEKAELAGDVTMQQDSQNAKAAEVERLRREVASAHAERHAAVQQVLLIFLCRLPNLFPQMGPS
jgi:hypothetical protein